MGAKLGHLISAGLAGLVILNLMWLLSKFINPSLVQEEFKVKSPIKPATPKSQFIQSPSVTSPSPSQHSRLLFLRSSPMSPKAESVSKRFSAQSVESPLSPNRRSGFYNTQSPLPSPFQNAVKPAQSPVRKEIIEDGLVLVDAEKTLSQWHCRHYLESWSENMRKWIASKVLQPLVKRIDAVDEELTKIGYTHLKCKVATYAESMNPIMQQSHANPLAMKQYPNTLSDFFNNFGNVALILI